MVKSVSRTVTHLISLAIVVVVYTASCSASEIDCQAVKDALRNAESRLVDKYNTCQRDSDCILKGYSTLCSAGCDGAAINSNNVSLFSQEYQTDVKPLCPENYPKQCPIPDVLCAPTPELLCVNQKCTSKNGLY